MVGGFLQLTSITEREISTRIIHRWSDEIGKRIGDVSTEVDVRSSIV
jgi:hypothetical protein